jgi:hypothetical protein
MRIFTNDELIAKRKKLAGRVATAAMLLLMGGLLTNCYSFRGGPGAINPGLYYALLGLLAAGFIAAIISSQLVNRWVKEPRSDQVLSKVLKGFDNNHYLFNYTTSIPHVLLTPRKIYVIAARNQDGLIRFRQGRWKQPFKLRRLIMFNEESLGNPAAEAQSYVERLRNLLADRFNDPELPEIEPVVIFTNPDVELELEEPVVPAMKGGALKEFVRRQGKGISFNAEQRQKLVDLLGHK